MQPIVAQPRAVVAPVRPVTMEDFMRHKPSTFSGKSTPDEADAWLRRGPTVGLDHRGPRQTLASRRSRILDHHLLPENCSVSIVVVNI